MKLSRFTCIACTAIALVISGGRAGAQNGSHGILGFLDPHTGAFRPVPSKPASGPVSLTLVEGTLVVNFHLTLKTKFSKKFPTICTVTATVTDFDTSTDAVLGIHEETASNKASGNLCTATLPYALQLGDPTTDVMSFTYEVSNLGEPDRESFQTDGASILVPTGKTTQDVDVTL